MFGFDLAATIIATGYAGIAAAVFLESGTPIGLVLPGDSLLFTAGLLASQGVFGIWWLLLLLIPAAILGDIAGYLIGKQLGPRLFSRPESPYFKPEYVAEANRFFVRYGARAILLSRFVPIVRCFVPIVAGAARMPLGGFMRYNALGALLWIAGLLELGYWLGRVIPDAQRYLLPLVLLIVFISFIPALWHLYRMRVRKDSTEGAESAHHKDDDAAPGSS
ncbi:MAG TPA: DedA family protein [Candidatus Paceibacterota bacterium]|nr:DedA family protein [Candidatus Paceibacterota bacterium]